MKDALGLGTTSIGSLATGHGIDGVGGVGEGREEDDGDELKERRGRKRIWETVGLYYIESSR